MRACSFFFFNDTATTEIYTLSLHDALPISPSLVVLDPTALAPARARDRSTVIADLKARTRPGGVHIDRKSTRLNSSHGYISYAVFCLKKKKKHIDKNTAPCEWPVTLARTVY